MLKINAVTPGGTGARLGLEPGDAVVAVNGSEIRDIIDYYFHITDECVELRVDKAGRGQVSLSVCKAYEDDLDLEFALNVRLCANNCLFCFVDQQPPGLRDTLYIKDDDYRLSFISGNYVTLSNLREGEAERIIAQRLSPLHVSVHATDPRVRGKLLGKTGDSDIMGMLRQFGAGGIDFHCQVVMCPGINDGPVLEQTLSELSVLGKHLLSLAIVPVGLTRHRQTLYPLKPVGRELARRTIELVDRFQARFFASVGRRTVYAADEFFVKAGLAIPPTVYYEQFSQLENGVGMMRRALDQLEQLARLRQRKVPSQRVVLVTGRAAYAVVCAVAAAVEDKLLGLTLPVLAVDNCFFGSEVTVAGLLAGADVGQALSRLDYSWQAAVLPEACVRAGQFIDGWSVEQLAQTVDRPLLVADDPLDLVEKLKREGA